MYYFVWLSSRDTNLQGPMQNKNAGPLSKYRELQDGDSWALKLAQAPLERGHAPITDHPAMEPALPSRVLKG